MRTLLCLIGVAVLCVIAGAQGNTNTKELSSVQKGTRVESEGTATVDAVPDYVEFWLHLKAPGATVADAVQATTGLDAALKTALDEREVIPFSIMISGPAVTGLEPPEAKSSAQLIFEAEKFMNIEVGAKEFAALCDKLNSAAKSLKCAIEGPVFTVDEPDQIEQAAVARAVENAHPAADGAAQVMGGYLALVESVQVLGISWDAPEKSHTPYPEIRRAICTANVHVVYGFAPAQR